MEGSIIKAMYNTVFDFFQGGGNFMWFILAIWGFGIAISLERFLKLTMKFDIDGPSFMNQLQRRILANDIQDAIRICSGSKAALPKVLKSGLKRANETPEQIQNAIDATALEVIPKVELRLNYLQLVANISTLLGLLGTIWGLILSFRSVSTVDPAQKSQLLTEGISKAMHTTFLGLVSAITVMMLHAYLSGKSEKIVNEIDEFSVKLMDMIGIKKEKEK